jgi:chromate transporter
VPGPISTLSAFVGYAAAGPLGAVLGTFGIYAPAFVAVLMSAPRLEGLRRVEGVRRALDGVVAVVAGAVLGVGVELAATGVQGPATATFAVLALLLALRWKVPAVWLIALGLGAGVARLIVI